MYPSIAMAAPRRRSVPAGAVIAAMVVLWFGLAALATPFDHDESQYVAGAFFARHLTIFRDFAYLQPPLHAWAYAPVAGLFPGNMVAAMRLVTAASAVAALLLIWMTQRAAGISRDSAAIAALLVASTAAFQFTAAVVRNDMLPTLLLSGGMLCAMLALRGGRRIHWVATGLCLGLALSAKLNFAPVGAMVGLFLLRADRRCGPRAAMLLALGTAVGMVPMMLAFAAAPEGFFYGVVTYGATAPLAWYAANGAADELTLLGKVGALLLVLIRGPALIGLLLIVGHWIATRGRTRSAGRRLAVWMMGGALAGAALPTPTQLQYILPLLPPLALALGYFLDDVRHWNAKRRHILLGLLSIGVLPGLLPTADDIAMMTARGSPALQADAAARRVGVLVRNGDRGDSLATLSPHMMASSGLRLDPRLATGPFIYRSGWTVPGPLAHRIGAMVPATLGDLDRSPPAAILTGYEGGTRNLPIAPDAGLVAYARTRHYRAVAMADGRGMLYLRADPPPVAARMAGRMPQPD